MEKTSDIRFCCFYNISDTIQHYPHRPSKAYFCFCFCFFIFSAASNEKNKKPQSRAPLGYKLVWAAIEAMVTFMVQFFSRKRDSILIILLQPHVRIFKTAHKSQPSNILCTAAPLPQIKIGKGAPYFSDFFSEGTWAAAHRLDFQHDGPFYTFIFGKEGNNISLVPRLSSFRQKWTLRDVTERDQHRSFPRLCSDNEARSRDSFPGAGLGCGGITTTCNSMGREILGTSWPAIYSIKYKLKKMEPSLMVCQLYRTNG